MKLHKLMLAPKALSPFSSGGTRDVRQMLSFQTSEGVFPDGGGDALAEIEIRVFKKIHICEDSIGSATLPEPTGFPGSGVLPTT